MGRTPLHGGSSSHTTCRHGTVKRPLVAEPSKKADWPGQGQVVFELWGIGEGGHLDSDGVTAVPHRNSLLG